MIEINMEELEKVRTSFEPLNCTHLGKIFGDQFWHLLTLCLSKAIDDSVLRILCKELMGRGPGWLSLSDDDQNKIKEYLQIKDKTE